MKSIIATLAAAIMVVAAANVNAQPAQGQAGGQHQMATPEQRVQKMKDNLGLSDDQSAKILAIYQDAAKQASADGVTREQHMEIMKKAQTDVNAVLTPDQQAKAQAAMAAAQSGRGQGGQQGAGDNNNAGGKKGGRGGHRGGQGGGNGGQGGGDNSGDNAGGGGDQ